MISRRTVFADSFEGKKWPWIFKCDKHWCFYTVAAKDWLGILRKRSDHGKTNLCPRIGPTYHNRQLISNQSVVR